MRLDWNYKGGLLKFFLVFQNVYLDLENCNGKTVPDEEKIGALNASMDDSWFSSVCTTIESLALQTKTPIDYATWGGGKGGGDTDRGKDKPWKNDSSVWVPKNEFYNIPREEKEKQIKVRAEAKRAREAQALQMDSLQNTQPQVPTAPGTTMVIFAPGTQVMTPVSAGISNGENNQSGWTPTICEIMASQTQPRAVNSSMTRLPAGIYIDQTGRQFQVNAM
eukprot:3276296-Ditylum_brightwellii.AAC.1